MALLHYSALSSQVSQLGLSVTLQSFQLVHLKAIRDREEERPEISAGEQLGFKKALTLGETGKPEANTTSSDQSDNGHDSRPGSATKLGTKRANTV